ncbi:ATP-binding protein [Phenylobacterium sp.]|uniref:sensor histidine kinase n=1 Tax=Phenylobacterium sp. TaxID=1871053 RepID=UPI0025D46C0D|nr:ATP-binding protein [Phenylobacterium sp.]
MIQFPSAPAEDGDDILEMIDDRPGESEGAAPGRRASEKLWRVLVVDDDPDVHVATRFAIGRNPIAGREVELLSAYSAAEGKQVLDDHRDVAVVLLDVVMEEHDSGLKFVEWMRAGGYEKQRIILRTGQPGYAPELEVIRNYDINDYRTKGELTQTRLVTAMTAAIRTFEQFWTIDEQRLNLESFAYALAHDFRQTTRQIRTYSELVGDGLDGEAPASSALDYLSGAARRLNALVEVMSQYTLLAKPAELEVVDLPQLMDEVRATLAPILADTGGTLEAKATGACRANAALLGHVLQILVANGLQHNDHPKPHVEIRTSVRDGQCMIEVVDNGIGIEADHLEEIFEPHMRLRPTKEMPATGLGLTLSRRAVESQGGAIWCVSTPAVGSTFHVSLPMEGRA